MITKNDKITFQVYDLPFLQKHGFSKAVAIYTQHCQQSDLPFIQDFTQLAGLFSQFPYALFSTLRSIDSLYYQAKIPKAKGGFRELQVPLQPLRYMQEVILHSVLNRLPVSEYATAYHKGAQLIHNALPHQNKKFLLKMDVKDFFSSITFEQVLNCVFHKKRFPTHVGVALTTLCCKNNVLPQGAPTSPALSNLVMVHFDEVMGNWCKKQGFAYTRYCDDITISGDRPLYVAYQKAKNLLADMGMECNQKKTRFISSANRQTVTGLTVNQGVCVSSPYKRQLRQAIYYTFRYGPNEHIRRCGLTEFLQDDIPMSYQYLRHLLGQVQYVLSVEPNNAAFLKERARLTALLEDDDPFTWAFG